MKKYFMLLLALICCACGKTQSQEKKEWVFLIHAQHCEITPEQLVLIEPNHYALAFTDGPKRKSAMISSEKLIEQWPQLFVHSTPNATITYHTSDKEYHSYAVELTNPKFTSGRISFTIKALDNVKIESDRDLSEVTLFIDGAQCEAPMMWCKMIDHKIIHQ